MFAVDRVYKGCHASKERNTAEREGSKEEQGSILDHDHNGSEPLSNGSSPSANGVPNSVQHEWESCRRSLL